MITISRPEKWAFCYENQLQVAFLLDMSSPSTKLHCSQRLRQFGNSRSSSFLGSSRLAWEAITHDEPKIIFKSGARLAYANEASRTLMAFFLCSGPLSGQKFPKTFSFCLAHPLGALGESIRASNNFRVCVFNELADML